MSRELERICSLYKGNKNTGQLRQRLRGLKGTHDVTSEQQELLLDAMKLDLHLYSFLTGKNSLKVKEKGEQISFAKMVKQKLNKDIALLATQLSNDEQNLEGFKDNPFVKEFEVVLQSMARGDIAPYLSFKTICEKYQASLDAFVYKSTPGSERVNLLHEAANQFYQKTGNVQIFRFLIADAQDALQEAKALSRYGYNTAYDIMTGQPIVPTKLACAAALPNGDLFNTLLDAKKEAYRSYDLSVVDVINTIGESSTTGAMRFAATSIFDYIAVGTMPASERVRRIEAIFSKFPDLKRELLQFEEAKDVISHEYKQWVRIKEALGFPTTVWQANHTTYYVPLALHRAVSKKEGVGKEFLEHWKKQKHLNPYTHLLLRTLYLQCVDTEGVVIYSSSGLPYEQTLAVANQEISSYCNSIADKLGALNDIGILDAVYNAIEQLDADRKTELLQTTAALLITRKHYMLPYVYYTHLLKLSFLLKTNMLSKEEFDENIDANRLFYEKEHVDFIRQSFSVDGAQKGQPLGGSEEPRVRMWIPHVLSGLVSVGFALLCGFDPLFLFSDVAHKIIGTVVFSVMSAYCFYRAAAEPYASSDLKSAKSVEIVPNVGTIQGDPANSHSVVMTHG